MLKYFFTVLFALSLSFIYAQDYNLNLIGELDYDEVSSDIWGYVDDQGTEYAIMGTYGGTAIISLADPTNPTEVAFIDGGNSDWRDMKSYGDYAYVTTEAPDGLLVVNLSDVENGNVTHYFYQPNFQSVVWGPLQTIHNLYIDENGFCYLAGSNLNNGGVLILDLNQDPEDPPLVGKGEDIYSHDVYVRNDTCWSSNVNDGHFSVIDVSDKTAPVTLAYQETSFNFTHNAWLSDSGQYLFTTDELPNANIDAYDVSDINNIVEVDRWVPKETQGTGVIPHNVHVLNDYLVISYYTDGVKVVDAHRPSNLVEVGSYDTYDGGTGFFGCWGAYPFLPSGLVLASDIQRGLLVFQPNYVRACYLEGLVTDASTGLALNDASIQISSGVTEVTPSNGEYATGQTTPGVFQVTFSKIGYVSQTVDVTLINGEVTIQDMALVPAIPLEVTGQVLEEGTGNPIPNAAVRLQSESASLATTTDNDGNFIFNEVLQNEYEIYAGKWGYFTVGDMIIVDGSGSNTITMELGVGYADPFAVDLGWTESGNATAGTWELGAPVGTFTDGLTFNPDADVDGDIGNWAYITGNDGSTVAVDDVDGGVTTLTSPVFDLSSYTDPYVKYQAWFMNGGSTPDPNDELVIRISNGTDEAVIETINTNTNDWIFWNEFRIADYVSPSSTMTMIVETSDLPGTGHLVEAGFDNFLVNDGPTFQTLTGTVLEVNTSNPIAGAAVRIQGESVSYTTNTDGSGNFIINDIFPDAYEVYAGSWGHTTEVANADIIEGNPNTVLLELDNGYEDPFAVDLGWTTSGNAIAGIWELGEPLGTNFNGSTSNPDDDVDGDVGNWCYVTGNAGGTAGNDDVDNGNTILVSPIFDLSTYNDPYFSYQAFFFNASGNSDPNDNLIISIGSNGNEVVVETIDENTNGWTDPVNFRVYDYVGLSNNMYIKVETADQEDTGHLVEAGFDNFLIFDDIASSVFDISDVSLDIAPNPFNASFRITIPENTDQGTVQVFDIVGREIYQHSIDNDTILDLDTEKWASGLYQVILTTEKKRYSSKVIKQ